MYYIIFQIVIKQNNKSFWKKFCIYCFWRTTVQTLIWTFVIQLILSWSVLIYIFNVLKFRNDLFNMLLQKYFSLINLLDSFWFLQDYVYFFSEQVLFVKIQDELLWEVLVWTHIEMKCFKKLSKWKSNEQIFSKIGKRNSKVF